MNEREPKMQDKKFTIEDLEDPNHEVHKIIEDTYRRGDEQLRFWTTVGGLLEHLQAAVRHALGVVEKGYARPLRDRRRELAEPLSTVERVARELRRIQGDTQAPPDAA